VRIDTKPVEGSLDQIQPLEFTQVRRSGDEPLFNSLMDEHHYLGYEQPVGEHLKYLVWAQGRPVACVAWSSAPRHPGARDHYIGWNQQARGCNIRFIAYNTRFLILPWVRVNHLASHILGPNVGADLGRLAANVRASDLLSGNVRGSGAIPRHLLPRGQLGVARQDHGTRQAIQQLRAEPVDQTGSGISVDEAIS
jgi:Domain of unknown function (DUF4338)